MSYAEGGERPTLARPDNPGKNKGNSLHADAPFPSDIVLRRGI